MLVLAFRYLCISKKIYGLAVYNGLGAVVRRRSVFDGKRVVAPRCFAVAKSATFDREKKKRGREGTM